VVVDSAGVEIVTSVAPAWEVGEEWRVAEQPLLEIGMTDGPDEYLLARVSGARRLSDGSIVVANAQTADLRLFDAEGRHLRTIGRRGKGPGEFGDILWLTTLPGDSVLTYDFPARRLSLFTSAGELVEVSTLDRDAGVMPKVVGRFGDGTIAATVTDFGAATRDGELTRIPEYLLRFSRDGTRADTFARLAGTELYTEESTTSEGMRIVSMSEPLFGRSIATTVAADRPVFGSNERYELKVVTPEGRLERLIRRSEPSRPVTDAVLEAARRARAQQAKTPEEVEQRLQGLQDDPHGATIPFFERLLGDDEGNLWVQEFAVPGEEEPGWAVFDPQGRLLGLVRLPERFRPMHIGADFVLGVAVDDLEVERVRMYSLQKPGRG
jgi:hypothetical protein